MCARDFSFPAIKLNAVGNLQAAVESAGSISLRWRVPNDTDSNGLDLEPIGNYTVSWSAVEPSYAFLQNKTVDVDATLDNMTYTVTSLPPNTTIIFQVSARDATGDLGPSVTTQARTLESGR